MMSQEKIDDILQLIQEVEEYRVTARPLGGEGYDTKWVGMTDYNAEIDALYGDEEWWGGGDFIEMYGDLIRNTFVEALQAAVEEQKRRYYQDALESYRD